MSVIMAGEGRFIDLYKTVLNFVTVTVLPTRASYGNGVDTCTVKCRKGV